MVQMIKVELFVKDAEEGGGHSCIFRCDKRPFKSPYGIFSINLR